MRILRRGIGHRVFGHGAGLGIELADVALEVGGEPDVAIAVGDQPVRPGARSLERELLEGAALRIEASERVVELPGVPEHSVGREERIVRARARGWQHPFVHFDARRAGNEDRRGQGLLRKVLREVVGDDRDLRIGNLRTDIAHHRDVVEPSFARVTRARDGGQLVALYAMGLDGFATLAFGQAGRLAPCGEAAHDGDRCGRTSGEGHGGHSFNSGMSLALRPCLKEAT